MRIWIVLGSINMFLCVALGAFGAHILKELLKPDMLEIYKTGVQYHMAHALGLILIGVASPHFQSNKFIQWAGRLIFIGILIFSGSLYILSITGITILGAITPIGGVSFLAGWLLLVVAAIKSKTNHNRK